MNWWIVVGVFLTCAGLLTAWLLTRYKYVLGLKAGHIGDNTPESVGGFYNDQTDNFIKVYGEVIQAFRTKDVSKLLDYQIDSIGFKKGWRVIDAGCGVCGPARYFARNADVTIDAVTISKTQVEKSDRFIADEKLSDKVKVHHGDFHQLENSLEKGVYDAVYFLESFGHARDHEAVLNSAWEMIKPGGVVYIKDLFLKEGAFPSHDLAIRKEAENINRAYHYNVADLYHILKVVRKKGFIVSFVKTIDLDLEEFENLTISNDFQELTGINKIENLREYVFPVDFFEIKLIKPWTDVNEGNSRYFLQNMYFMQVEGWKKEQL